MPKIWVEIDGQGNIKSGSTTHPDQIKAMPGDVVPNYEYEFDLTWEQIGDMHNCKVENDELKEKDSNILISIGIKLGG